MNNSLFEKALLFAIRSHSGSYRKGGNSPYILHPMEVAAIVGRLTDDEEILAAAVLHDTVEDTDATIEEIRDQFGERVAFLVASETEDKMKGIPASESWLDRKKRTLKMLKEAKDPGVRLIWFGDKLSNLRSFRKMQISEGPRMWENFNQRDPRKQRWYYERVLEQLQEYKDEPAWREYNMLLGVIFDEQGGEKE